MATMLLNASTFVHRDPDAIFRELHDPETLVSCVPGASLTRITGPGSFEARIAIGHGFLKSQLKGKGRIVASDPKTRTASLDLTGDPSANLATLRVHVTVCVAKRDGGSEVHMSFDIVTSDRTLLKANAWLDPVASDLLDRMTRRLKQQLEEAPVVPFPPAA